MCLQYMSFENAVEKKERLLVTSNFSFSDRAFYAFVGLSDIFIKSKTVVFRLFSLEDLSFGKG